jgi:Lar family restriction alleviation protein
MPKPKLKPCPFCGSDDVELDLDYRWRIVCRDCDSKGSGYEENKKAVAAWNRRAPARKGKRK